MHKTAVIIGAKSGIGYATEQELIKQWHNVFAGDISNCDVRKPNQVKNFLSTVGKIDLLINTASVHSSQTLDEAKITEFDRVTETNMRGVFTVCREALPYLRKTKGMLINIASAVGVVPDRNAPLYSAGKAWMIHFTKCLALKYAREGIRFNCICPGPTNTPFLRNACQNDCLTEAANINPLGRIAEPEEIARVIVAMANSQYTTGAVWTIDGGESINCFS